MKKELTPAQKAMHYLDLCAFARIELIKNGVYGEWIDIIDGKIHITSIDEEYDLYSFTDAQAKKIGKKFKNLN